MQNISMTNNNLILEAVPPCKLVPLININPHNNSPWHQQQLKLIIIQVNVESLLSVENM